MEKTGNHSGGMYGDKVHMYGDQKAQSHKPEIPWGP